MPPAVDLLAGASSDEIGVAIEGAEAEAVAASERLGDLAREREDALLAGDAKRLDKIEAAMTQARRDMARARLLAARLRERLPEAERRERRAARDAEARKALALARERLALVDEIETLRAEIAAKVGRWAHLGRSLHGLLNGGALRAETRELTAPGFPGQRPPLTMGEAEHVGAARSTRRRRSRASTSISTPSPSAVGRPRSPLHAHLREPARRADAHRSSLPRRRLGRA